MRACSQVRAATLRHQAALLHDQMGTFPAAPPPSLSSAHPAAAAAGAAGAAGAGAPGQPRAGSSAAAARWQAVLPAGTTPLLEVWRLVRDMEAGRLTADVRVRAAPAAAAAGAATGTVSGPPGQGGPPRSLLAAAVPGGAENSAARCVERTACEQCFSEAKRTASGVDGPCPLLCVWRRVCVRVRPQAAAAPPAEVLLGQLAALHGAVGEEAAWLAQHAQQHLADPLLAERTLLSLAGGGEHAAPNGGEGAGGGGGGKGEGGAGGWGEATACWCWTTPASLHGARRAEGCCLLRLHVR